MKAELRRILVPLDGSPEAEAALEAIKPLVGAYDPEVLLLHVEKDPEAGAKMPVEVLSAAKALRSSGVQCSMVTREGNPAEEILSVAQERWADVIALSTHGRTGLRRALLGSVAEEVLRASRVPVLVCRPGAAAGTWKTIVVPLDGSARSEEILAEASRMAGLQKAELHLVQAALPRVVAGGVGELGVYLPPEDPMPYLRATAGALAARGVTARLVALEGRAATEVVRYAKEVGAGLICMASHGRTGMARLLLGSVAEEILRHAPCPVLVRRTTRRAEKSKVRKA
jgi:nucleotide-binding universal stress UspA family protein